MNSYMKPSYEMYDQEYDDLSYFYDCVIQYRNAVTRIERPYRVVIDDVSYLPMSKEALEREEAEYQNTWKECGMNENQ